MKINIFIILPLLVVTLSCNGQKSISETSDIFYEGFVHPPAEARPFVRWWWNGNQVEKKELTRELDVLQKTGIGGIEINPIAMPEEVKAHKLDSIKWLSKEWNELVAFSSKEAKKRNLITDLIVGSGWPFGGEFLAPSEYTQRVLIHKINIDGPASVNMTKKELLRKIDLGDTKKEADNQILFMSLLPTHISKKSEVVDLMSYYTNEKLNYKIDSGQFELVYGILQKGYREVMHGAYGASGNVMNHYDKQVTKKYLERLEAIEKDTGIPLNELIRALFCDSIELSGANWTNEFLEIFEKAYNYNLKPYLPFIFYNIGQDYLSENGYDKNEYDTSFKDELQRVRYDYNKLLVEVFLENFVKEFQKFCSDQGVECRYQAYGTPFLMGISEGYMIPDIPEGNNWIYSGEMNDSLWRWNKDHGYMGRNHYAAAGGHLSGKKIISCESMTNLGGVFRTSLQQIKQHDDMNFISGMNHSILHGFNYSPPEAGFPGWVRYGTYFSEQNTWWPYFHKWVTYNSRLSYVFQNSKPQKTIAILGPTNDIWSDVGLSRGYFVKNPWYLHELWEGLSQVGSSGEYINENVLQNADVEDGVLSYGPMRYESLWLSGVKSIKAETALRIQNFVKNGGVLMMIDSIPSRTPSYMNHIENDSVVNAVFTKLKERFSDRVFFVKSPQNGEDLLTWTQEKLNLCSIKNDVLINRPSPGLYQIHKKNDEKDIYFFTNSWQSKTLNFDIEFPFKKGIPWVWNPESGERYPLPYTGLGNKLSLTLGPIESILLIFENFENDGTVHSDEPAKLNVNKNEYTELAGIWNLSFLHKNGERFERQYQNLKSLLSTKDSALTYFAGEISYKTTFDANEEYTIACLDEVNQGITELFLNGHKVGERWYGQHSYDLKPFLKSGLNELEIIYTTTLANYSIGLKDNPMVQKWTANKSLMNIGIDGPIRIYKEGNGKQGWDKSE